MSKKRTDGPGGKTDNGRVDDFGKGQEGGPPVERNCGRRERRTCNFCGKEIRKRGRYTKEV